MHCRGVEFGNEQLLLVEIAQGGPQAPLHSRNFPIEVFHGRGFRSGPLSSLQGVGASAVVFLSSTLKHFRQVQGEFDPQRPLMSSNLPRGAGTKGPSQQTA